MAAASKPKSNAKPKAKPKAKPVKAKPKVTVSPLVRSALEVLEHGLWHFFRSSTATDMKFALMHVDQAVELIFKPDLELLHEERNNIQHKFANPSAEDAAFHIEKAVKFIDRFLRGEQERDAPQPRPPGARPARRPRQAGASGGGTVGRRWRCPRAVLRNHGWRVRRRSVSILCRYVLTGFGLQRRARRRIAS